MGSLVSVGAVVSTLANARQHLATITEPAEAREAVDMAAALKDCAEHARLGYEVCFQASELKLEAERKAGEVLAAMPKAKGGRGKTGDSRSLVSLGISKKDSSRWQREAKVPEDQFRAYIEESKSKGKDITTAGLLKLANQTAPKNGAKKPKPVEGICTDLSELVTSGHRFGTIYADPPWSYNNQGTRAATGNHYDGDLSIEQLCEMPVGDLAADKCHLHLWTTNAFLFECPRLFDAWGFEFKSSFVWVKPQMGIGNYWRNSHEIMLLAIRGGQVGLSKSETSWLECRRGMHSAKPEEARQRIERLSPGPFLELFGRSPRQGWTVFGNQIVDELVL